MSQNSPKPGDTDNNLLWKLLNVFGGSPKPADGSNILLQKLVRAAEAAQAGIEALTYAASVQVDFGTAEDKTITLSGDLALTSAGLEAGREVSIRVIADGSTRTLSFPSGWTFIGSEPSDIAANKTGVLSLKSYGSADADVVAAWAVEA
jgi:hypothetical protein